MQNPGGNHPAPATAAAAKSKSSGQGVVVALDHGRQPSPATLAAAKSKSSATAGASGHCHHSSPSMPVVGKSKPSAHAAAPGQASTSHQPHSVGVADAAASSLKRKRSVFQKDLQHMMYGFGDDPNVHKAQNVASKRVKLLTEDFLYLIRKDMRKLHRATELLSMNEELKQARKAFDVNEETLVVTNE